MTTRCFTFGVVCLGLLFLAGCGGGGGGSAQHVTSTKSVARARIIATTRVTRATFAIAGIAKKITRAPQIGMGQRVALLLAALRRTRSVTQGLDPETGLYYVLNINADGSGREDMYGNPTHTEKGGFFSWPAPQWHNNQPNTYPAVLHITFQITAGMFAGDHGTLDVTLNDATGNNGLMLIVLQTAHGEKGNSNFQVHNGMISGKDNVQMDDGTDCTEVDEVLPSGDMQCTIDFPDGSTEVETMTPDGGETETYTAPDGQQQASGDVQSDGSDTISYDDGSSETVNVDTGNSDNSGGDSSGSNDSSGGGGDSSGGGS